MANRKYVNDYRREDCLDAKGRHTQRYVYRGTWYTPIAAPGLHSMLAAAGTVAVGLLPLLLSGDRLSRTVYVTLPAVLALEPWVRLVSAARLLRNQQLTRQQKDRLTRLPCRRLFLLLTAACAGVWIRGCLPGEGVAALGLHLAAGASAGLLLLCRQIKIKELGGLYETNPTETGRSCGGGGIAGCDDSGLRFGSGNDPDRPDRQNAGGGDTEL